MHTFSAYLSKITSCKLTETLSPYIPGSTFPRVRVRSARLRRMYKILACFITLATGLEQRRLYSAVVYCGGSRKKYTTPETKIIAF